MSRGAAHMQGGTAQMMASWSEPPLLEGLPADPALACSALTATLELVPTAALVVRADGHVAQANWHGRKWLQGRSKIAPVSGHPQLAQIFRITRLEASNELPHFLLVRRGAEDPLGERLRTRAAQWKLTPRLVAVMELIARGESNVCIAAELGISRRTVEHHVSTLLQRTGCGSRAVLMARFWS